MNVLKAGAAVFSLYLLSLPALALELIVPAYRTHQYNHTMALTWSEQVSFASPSTERRVVDLSSIPEVLADRVASAVLIEVPPVYFKQALELGWVPTHRVRDLAAFGIFGLPEQTRESLKLVGTPPARTLASKLAPKFTEAPLLSFDDHTSCIRGVLSRTVDACVTIQKLVNDYSEQFDIEFQQLGSVYEAPPSVMLASPLISADQLAQLKSTPIELAPGFVYVRFDPARDEVLFQQ